MRCSLGRVRFTHHPTTGFRDFVIRPAFIPALIATEQSFDLGRRAVTTGTYREASAPLTMFLRNVFRKREFRPLQGEAIFNALRQNDCVVLLPTGAGKSLIYQLAGLLMPGLTLVVGPDHRAHRGSGRRATCVRNRLRGSEHRRYRRSLNANTCCAASNAASTSSCFTRPSGYSRHRVPLGAPCPRGVFARESRSHR